MKVGKIFLMILILIVAWIMISVDDSQLERTTDFVENINTNEAADSTKEDNFLPAQSQEEPEKVAETNQIVYGSRKRVTVLATAYYGPLPNQNSYATGSYRGDIKLNGTGTTKSGKEVRVGHIAADWSVIPQGSKVYIPGYGDAVVEDIGGAIKGNRIDVFMGYGEEGLRRALKWGRRWVTVTVK